MKNYIVVGYDEKEINNYSKNFGNGFAYISYPEIKKHPKNIVQEVREILFAHEISYQPIVITTFSETVVNYIATLIIKEQIINNFEVHVVHNKNHITKHPYTRKGYLEKWHIGFFDW